MTTVDDALGWANRIDERLGPISGADADRLARFLRRMAEEVQQSMAKEGELRALLLMERQTVIGQAVEIQRLRALGKEAEKELEEAFSAVCVEYFQGDE